VTARPLSVQPSSSRAAEDSFEDHIPDEAPQEPSRRPWFRWPRRSGAPRRPRGPRRRTIRIVSILAILAVAWPLGLFLWANTRLHHVDALSNREATPGTTWLIAGTDRRGSGGVDNADVEGARTDTIMILHSPPSGTTALMSLPRDTYVAIPGHGKNKINAAYAIGGPKLLVKTVEKLTGITIDHYVELGFGSVVDIVDAVSGVELCYDKSVKDPDSKLKWKKGCHQADGKTALAFSRMRYQDPLGDIGRALRQRQVVGAVMKRALTPATFINPVRQVRLLTSGTSAVVVDEKANLLDLGKLAFAFKRATGPGGATGTPTIASLGYDPGGGVGSAVLLDDKAAAKDFKQLAKGTWTGSDSAGQQ